MIVFVRVCKLEVSSTVNGYRISSKRHFNDDNCRWKKRWPDFEKGYILRNNDETGEQHCTDSRGKDKSTNRKWIRLYIIFSWTVYSDKVTILLLLFNFIANDNV